VTLERPPALVEETCAFPEPTQQFDGASIPAMLKRP